MTLLRFACAGAIALVFNGANSSAQSPSVVPLPDPLVTQDGTHVTTAGDWLTRRKPELRALFEKYMYGHYPAAPKHVEGRTLFEDASAFDGKGTLREVELTFGPPAWPKIYLLIASPNVREGARAPACFVGPNFGGNHMRLDDARIRIPTAWVPAKYPGVVNNHATEAGRGKQTGLTDVWPMADAIDRGYAIATFYCGDAQPDRPLVMEAMRAVKPSTPNVFDTTETATIMWWAWGVHRAVDFLVTDAHVDGKRLAVVGHSRLGKAALLAGAFDDRIALSIPNCAGCGGSGPSRHNDPRAETVAVITKNNPHWFCANFNMIGAQVNKLPFDQNCLVAMRAPRAVLFNAAEQDVWANQAGQFEVLRSASPVYKLFGVGGLEASEMPAAGDSLIDSRLGFMHRKGVHKMSPADWQTFFAFADKWLK